MMCMFAEELFSLGPDELGSLEDKEKPGAKVRFARCLSERWSDYICVKDNAVSSSFLRSEWSHWSSRDCLPVCCWWTSRVPPLPTSRTALAGTAARSGPSICVCVCVQEGEREAQVLISHFHDPSLMRKYMLTFDFQIYLIAVRLRLLIRTWFSIQAFM